jgi:glycosyltransferase involved in cell wall biosynthesis
MKRIGILLGLNQYGGGTYQWTLNILESLAVLSETTKVKIVIVSKSANDSAYITEKYPQFELYNIPRLSGLFNRLVIKLYNMFPALATLCRVLLPLNYIGKAKKLDLLIFPGANLDICLYNRKSIFMFCDISHKYYPHFPEIGGENGIRIREIIFTNGCANATAVIVESEELKREVSKFYAISPSKIFVLYQIFSTQLLISTDDEDKLLPESYIFYPAQLWKHKNHLNLLKGFKMVQEKFPEMKLVLTGSRKEGDEEIFQLIDTLGLKDSVLYYGYVSDNLISKIFKNAFAMVMPTYFGPTNIPTLEAFHYGCPAVISDLPGVREQAGEAALYFNPDHYIEIAEQILALSDATYRQQQIDKGYERINILSFKNYNRDFHAQIQSII